MESENLVRMANSIGDFFEALPDRDEAMEGIATHVRKFWEPRMRAQLQGIIERGGDGLSPLVFASLRERMFAPADRR